MDIAEITTLMTAQINRLDHWRPASPVIPCMVTCPPKSSRDGVLIPAHHGGHFTLPMIVPIAVSASITIGNVRVVE